MTTAAPGIAPNQEGAMGKDVARNSDVLLARLRELRPPCPEDWVLALLTSPSAWLVGSVRFGPGRRDNVEAMVALRVFAGLLALDGRRLSVADRGLVFDLVAAVSAAVSIEPLRLSDRELLRYGRRGKPATSAKAEHVRGALKKDWPQDFGQMIFTSLVDAGALDALPVAVDWAKERLQSDWPDGGPEGQPLEHLPPQLMLRMAGDSAAAFKTHDLRALLLEWARSAPISPQT